MVPIQATSKEGRLRWSQLVVRVHCMGAILHGPLNQTS
jgi:hypothetical protein